MSRLQELMESRTVIKPRRAGIVHEIPNEKFDEIEAELLAPLKADNARLTAQVAAGKKIYDYVRHNIFPSDMFEILLDDWDAATAPAVVEPMNAMNAHSERIEEPVPLDPFRREWIRETEGILAKHEQRLDALVARVTALEADMDERDGEKGLDVALTTALEAARQEPPPTPSAPVEVTDRLIRNLAEAVYGYSMSPGDLMRSRIRRVLEAAFAAREREVQGASN